MQRRGPDSLEGLFILVVSCMISTLMYGITGLSSMLFVASVARYDTDRNQASFPYVLCTVLQAVSGPFAGYFAKKFNVRIVVLSGSILAFLGIGACYFAEDITAITILWGVVYGTGFGLSSLLLPVIINEYFVKQRSMALGMCYLGSPIGFFIFPPAFELLLKKYGLSGTFLILSGINMHCVPLSMLLKQPNFKPKYENSPLNNEAKHESYLSTNSTLANQSRRQMPGKTAGVNHDVVGRRHSVEFLWKPPIRSEKLSGEGKKYVLSLNKNCFQSTESTSDIYRSFKKSSRNQYESDAGKGHITVGAVQENSGFSGNAHLKSSENQTYTNYVRIEDNLHCYDNKGFQASEKLNVSAKEENEFLKKKDYEQISTIYFGADKNSRTITGKESHIKNQKNFHDVQQSALILSNNLKFNSISKIPSEERTNLTLLKYTKTDEVSQRADGRLEKQVIAKARDVEKNNSQNSMLSMYFNPIFILMCIINAIVNFHFTTLTTIIIDFSRDHAIDFEYEKYIMMIISLTGAFGMLGFGWVTDGGHLSRTTCGSLSQLIGSICTASLPFTAGFDMLVIPLAVWCTCQSSFIPLIPAITADYFNEDMHAVAISACNVLSGPLYLMIPSLIGYFRDSQGSYDKIFFLLSILSFLNSIAVSTIPCLARWRLKNV